MRKIFTIGETVYDIIFGDGKIQAGKPGGSVLNASVSLGRLGLNVHFISELANDDVGVLIVDFLKSNNIQTRYIDRFNGGQTPLALAFLDEQKNAKYSFYKDYPDKRLQQKFPEVSENDIVLFGSFFSANPKVRGPVKRFVKQARENGAIIIYDPNIRKPQQKQIPEMTDMIHENFSMAHIVRASNEDFEVIFDIYNAKDAFQLICKHGNANLIYTTGGDKVEVLTKNETMIFPVPEIPVISTIGAGDNFNAGLIFSLLQQNIHKNGLLQLREKQWEKLVNFGIACSQEVCKSFENYISPVFANNIVLK